DPDSGGSEAIGAGRFRVGRDRALEGLQRLAILEVVAELESLRAKRCRSGGARGWHSADGSGGLDGGDAACGGGQQLSDERESLRSGHNVLPDRMRKSRVLRLTTTWRDRFSCATARRAAAAARLRPSRCTESPIALRALRGTNGLGRRSRRVRPFAKH